MPVHKLSYIYHAEYKQLEGFTFQKHIAYDHILSAEGSDDNLT